jgi:hypothetical protein
MRYIAFDIHFPSDQGEKYSIGEIILTVDFFKITVRITLANVLKSPHIISNRFLLLLFLKAGSQNTIF